MIQPLELFVLSLKNFNGKGLSRIREFGFVHPPDGRYFDRRGGVVGPSMSTSRYIVFDSGVCGPWIEAEDEEGCEGNLYFGNGREVYDWRAGTAREPLNRVMETDLGDTWAFKDPLRIVRGLGMKGA